MRSVELCYKNLIKELNHRTKDKWFPLKSFHILSMMESPPLPLHTLHRTRQPNQSPHPQAQGKAEQQGCPHVWDFIWRPGDQGTRANLNSIRALSDSFPSITPKPTVQRISKLKIFKVSKYLEKYLLQLFPIWGHSTLKTECRLNK